MRIHLLQLLLLLPFYIQAQKDSSSYFIKQLNKKNQPDSVIALFNIKLGDLYSEKNPSRALTYSRQAFHSAIKTASDRLLYAATNNIAENFSDLGLHDSSLYYAKQCNEAAQRTQDPYLIFKSLNLVGNIYLEKLELIKAKKNYDEALQLSLDYPSLPHLSNIYHNLGNYYFKALNFKKSIEILKQGEDIARKSNDQADLMGIYGNLGQMYAFTGKVDSAQHYLLTALDYFHKSGNIEAEAVVNQKLGSVYGLFNNNAKMEQYLDKAYTQFKSSGNNIDAVNSLMMKVNSYFRSYQFDKCLQILNTIEPLALKNDQTAMIGMSYLYKAGIFTLTGDTANGRKYQQMAEQISRKINIPAFGQMNMMIKAIVMSTQLKLSQGDSVIQKALLAAKNLVPKPLMQTTLESFSLNKELMNTNKEDVADVYQTFLSTDSSKINQQYDLLINQPIDASLTALYNKQLLELETQYKTLQKTDSIRTQTQLIAFKTKSITTRNYFLAGLGLLVLLILILFLLSRKQAKQIRHQYSEIQQLQSELTHRTGNFFNSIKGMLAVASVTTTDIKTISSLNQRVSTINRLYNTLYSSPGKSQLQFAELLASICNDFEHSFGNEKQIKIYHQCAAAVSKEEALPLAFIITELLTNAEKYAFEGKESGEIHIEVTTGKSKRTLHVWDNGMGKDENATRQGSQGMNIIKSYSKNLQGIITSWNDNGHHFKMEF